MRLGAGHRAVDLLSGAGLPAALDGVETVLDASNNAGRSARDLLVEGTRRLLDAESAAGIAHHVLISIVGIERVPLGYYKVKLEQEEMLERSSNTTSVLRATQFHQLIDRALSSTARLGVLPSGRVQLQPVDPREVASALIDAIEAGPWPERREFTGPEILSLGELARLWARARGRRRLRVPLPAIGAVGRGLRAGGLTNATAPRGEVTFAEWLRGKSADMLGR